MPVVLLNRAFLFPHGAGPWRVALLLWSLCCQAHAARGGDWQLQRQQDGIRVYMRAQPGSRFQEVKVEAEMPGTLAQFVALYSDVAHYPAVIRHTRAAYLLRRVSETEFYYYLETQLPAPVANRDAVMRLQFAYTPAPRGLLVHTRSVDGLVPARPGLVRVPAWQGDWQVGAVSASRLKISYCFRVDPGGALPAWLVNRLAPAAITQSFLLLRRSLALPRYQGQHFDFLTRLPG